MAEKIPTTIIGEDSDLSELGNFDSGNRLSENRTTERTGTAERSPNGNVGSSIPTLSPIDIGAGRSAGDNGADTGARRRGRPPGSKNRTSAAEEKTSPGSLESIEEILLSIHIGVAIFAGAPELTLTPEEAKRFSTAFQRVAKFYPTNLNPKMLAWINLAAVIGGIEGPKIMAIYNRTTQPRKAPVIPIRETPSKAATGTTGPVPTPGPIRAPNGDLSFANLAPSQLNSTPPIPGDEILT